MRLLGSHFVLGQTIEEALARAGSHREFLYSFDMLGEAARTGADAERYLDSYASAIEAIGKSAGNDALPSRPGISVKLSALHPRYRTTVARSRACRTDAEIARTGAACENVTSSISQSTPKRRIGWSCRSMSSPRHCAMPRWPDGMVSALRCRPIRSALGALIDWIADRRGKPEPAADGPSGQGRLLGHRDQARAGAGTCRLPGVYAQGDDRPLLPRLRAQVACGAAAALSAICHPQCADRCLRDRGCRRHRRL